MTPGRILMIYERNSREYRVSILFQRRRVDISDKCGWMLFFCGFVTQYVSFIYYNVIRAFLSIYFQNSNPHFVNDNFSEGRCFFLRFVQSTDIIDHFNQYCITFVFSWISEHETESQIF